MNKQAKPSEFPLAEAEQELEAPAMSEERDVLRIQDHQRTVSVGAPTTGSGGSDEDPTVPFFLPEGGASGERFELRAEVGAGGMGTVHRAFDVLLRREVAMKVLHAEVDHSNDALALFLGEAQLTAQLDHPNIVPVHDLGSRGDDANLFFTMKLVTGMTLGDVINKMRSGAPTTEHLLRVLRIMLKVCDAVEFAHSRGVVHCDLKPENVMLGSHGQVYVMDWGVAMLKSDRKRATAPEPPERAEVEAGDWVELPSSRARKQGSIVGTPSYMAPEQAMGLYEEIDERTDVYGVGGILYEVLTGKAPNQGRSPMAMLSSSILGSVPPPEGTAIWDYLPPGLCRIATRALSKDRADRYPDVRSLRRDIERFLDGGGWFATASYQRGDVIVAEGEAADTAYVIESGHCQVFKLQGDHQETVGHLGPGNVFGETAALSTGVRTATVVAKDDVSVRMVTRESLELELARNPLLGAFVRALATRFREAEEKLNARSE